MRTALGALLVVTAVVATAAAGAPTNAGVRTLATTTGRITAFAQDGRYLAWAATGRGCGQVVSLFDTARRRATALTRTGTPGCRMEAPVAQLAVATQGSQARALWSRYETGNNYYHWLFAGSTQQPRERDAGLISESTGDELRVSIAGDGPFLGLGWAHATEDLEANLPYTILDGGVKRLGSDLRLRVVPGMPAVAALAAGGGNVALVPRGMVGQTTSPRAALRDVQVRSAASLDLRSTATATGSVTAVTVSGARLVAREPALAETFALDGDSLRRVSIPFAAMDVRVGGTRVVYRVGRSIYLLGRARPLAVAATVPVGLSVDGTRLAWAESRGGHGRIRALTLP